MARKQLGANRLNTIVVVGVGRSFLKNDKCCSPPPSGDRFSFWSSSVPHGARTLFFWYQGKS
eukprot:4377256-Pyramimonas_sp.AAC.1